MFYNINEGIDALKNKDFKELKNVASYVSLEAQNIQGHTCDLDAIVNAFLLEEKKTPQLLLIEGVAGSGKTQFCQKLTINLWKQYDKNEMIIPLYIPLVNLLNPKLKAIEETLENIGFSQEQIIILKKSRNFVFILDGYNELYEFINLHFTNKLSEWRAKTIITCRSESLYFISDYTKYFVPFKENKRLTYGLQKIVIQPLSEIQVLSNSSAEYDVVNDRRLLSLIQTPLLLKAIPFIEKDFYNSFIEARLSWQEQKKLKPNPNKDYFWHYCKSIALTMQQQKTNTIKYIKTNSLFEGNAKTNVWEKFFTNDPEIQVLYAACPLIKIGKDIKFIDDELIDYFASKPIKECNLFKEASATVCDEADTETEPELPVIGRVSFTMQKGKIQQLVDRIKESSEFKKRLFEYIELSKTDSKYSKAAANAITGLNFAYICFSDKDFKGIKIPEADLTGAILDHTDLEGADLSYVKLESAWLRLANLKNANLRGVVLGELAYKELDEAVDECKYSPDGKYFAATTESKTTIYKVEKSGNLTVVNLPDLSAYGFQVNSTTSPNGQYFAKIDDCDIELYKIDESGKKILINTLTGHTDTIHSVTLSPDNQWLASGGIDQTVRLWSLSDLTKTQTLTGHTNDVNSVTFSPDNKWLASGGGDKTVRLWSLSDSTKTQTLTGHTNYVYSVTFSPDNQWLASGGGDGAVRVWSLSYLDKAQTLIGHTGPIFSVTFSPDNQWLASGSRDKTVRLWSLSDPTKTQTLIGHTELVNSVTFSPDNQWLASGSRDCTVRFWSLSYLDKTQTVTGHAGPVSSVTFSPDNQWLASGSNDGTVRLWNLSDPTKIQTLAGHNGYVSSVTFSPDNQWLASGGGDKTIRLWNLSDPTKTQTFTGHTNGVSSVTFSLDNQWLASADSGDKTVRLWSLSDPIKIQTLAGHTAPVTSITFSPDNQWLVSGSLDATIRLWSLSDPTKSQTLTGHTSYVNSVTFSPDNQWLASGSDDGTVRLWSLSGSNKTQTLAGHSWYVRSITFSPDNQWLASGSEDNTVRLWTKDTNGNWCGQFVVLTNFRIKTLSYTAIDTHLYLSTGGYDHSVRLWEQLPDKLILLWNTHPNQLFPLRTELTNAALSFTNSELLLQRGAIGKPKILELDDLEEISKLTINSPKPLIFSQNKTSPTPEEQQPDDLEELSNQTSQLRVSLHKR